jgi:hypothetical protein
LIHIIHFLYADAYRYRDAWSHNSYSLSHNRLHHPARVDTLPAILSSLLLTLIIRALHTLIELIDILSAIIVTVLSTLTSTIDILLSIVVVVLNITLSTLTLILDTTDLVADPVGSAAKATADVRGDVFDVASCVLRGVFYILCVAAEGVADGLFFVVDVLVCAVEAALCVDVSEELRRQGVEDLPALPTVSPAKRAAPSL